MAMVVRLGRLKFRCSEQEKGKKRENNPVSSASVLSKEQHGSMEEPYEVFTKYKDNYFIIVQVTDS